MTLPANALKPVTDPWLEAADNLRHAFFTRPGGHSKGIYRGLNTGLGSQDERDAVLANRALAATALGGSPDDLFTPYQVHSPDVVIMEDRIPGERQQADAVVTATPGIIIGIQTADCGPVLFADPEAGVAGAAHAGWKGATGGILENTITAMEGLGARRERIRAVLGPMISRSAYEVGPEFVERLVSLSPGNDRWLSPSGREDHAMFDLPGYIVERLQAAGVEARWTGHCTYADEDNFFSYRRKTHRGEPDYGRQLSAIVVNRRP